MEIIDLTSEDLNERLDVIERRIEQAQALTFERFALFQAEATSLDEQVSKRQHAYSFFTRMTSPQLNMVHEHMCAQEKGTEHKTKRARSVTDEDEWREKTAEFMLNNWTPAVESHVTRAFEHIKSFSVLVFGWDETKPMLAETPETVLSTREDPIYKCMCLVYEVYKSAFSSPLTFAGMLAQVQRATRQIHQHCLTCLTHEQICELLKMYGTTSMTAESLAVRSDIVQANLVRLAFILADAEANDIAGFGTREDGEPIVDLGEIANMHRVNSLTAKPIEGFYQDDPTISVLPCRCENEE
jgi:hypothetical protein